VPRVKVLYFLEDDGTVPFLEWLANLPGKAIVKCQVSLARLEAEGHELRRPIADYLGDGVYELRPSFRGVQHRILYFFHAREAVVISHGLVKEQRVPAVEIDRALKRMRAFAANPARHTFVPGRKGV
jgi:phage-related protein